MLTPRAVSWFEAPADDINFNVALSMAFHTEAKLKMGHKVRSVNAHTINCVIDNMQDPCLPEVVRTLQLKKRRRENTHEFHGRAMYEIWRIQHQDIDMAPFSSTMFADDAPIRMHYRTMRSDYSRPRADSAVSRVYDQVELIMGEVLLPDGEMHGQKMHGDSPEPSVSDIELNPDWYARYMIDTTAVFFTGFTLHVLDNTRVNKNTIMPDMPQIFDAWHVKYLKDILEAWNVENMHKHALCLKCLQPAPADARIMKCAKCGVAPYCSKQCQVKDWSMHKQQCHRLASRQRLAQLLRSYPGATVLHVCCEYDARFTLETYDP